MAKKTIETNLPTGVIQKDLEYPKYNSKDRLMSDIGEYGTLTFYETKRFGWCITTLGISRGKMGRAARSYAVRVSDGSPVRIGNGPHVTRVVKVYVRTSRVKALQKYVDLYNKGAEDASTIRDRISSRRAEGALRRARGERSWYWDN